MRPLAKALLGAALTLPLVALVAGALLSPGPVERDRARPVIIGEVGAGDLDEARPQRGERPGTRGGRPGGPRGESADESTTQPGRDDDDPTERDEPFPVVTPAPRDLDDDEGGGGDDDDDGDDTRDDHSADD
ncbi:MAG TPA: hypothetical protein VD814_04990 [Nocardioides sp.]|nr:hypothetical protein [Nocardioides sp.]